MFCLPKTAWPPTCCKPGGAETVNSAQNLKCQSHFLQRSAARGLNPPSEGRWAPAGAPLTTSPSSGASSQRNKGWSAT